jgi:hypothetical protein
MTSVTCAENLSCIAKAVRSHAVARNGLSPLKDAATLVREKSSSRHNVVCWSQVHAIHRFSSFRLDRVGESGEGGNFNPPRTERSDIKSSLYANAFRKAPQGPKLPSPR